MLLLVLQLSLASSSGVDLAPSLGASTHFTARLLAQTAPPLPVDPVAETPRALVLKADIEALTTRIAAINVNWPTGAVVMAYAGGIVLYALLLASVALVATRAVGTVLLVMISLGVGAVGLLIVGLIVGNTTAAAARADREVLIQERSALERELKSLEERPPSVDRSFPSPMRVTVATF
ncbi:MAG: hypothetical protein Q8S33_04960 [Myxococcales bacterium]|nr:hypothetical protein [Myxococcales bacterium]